MFEVRLEPVSSTTSNVKVLPTELYGVKYRSVTHPAKGNPYNTTAKLAGALSFARQNGGEWTRHYYYGGP